MKVTAKIPSVREVTIEIPEAIQVDELKNILCIKLGIEPEYTSLMADGRILRSDEKVEALDLAGSEVIVDYLWARHLILWGFEGQSKIRNATVFIAGAGAIGNEVAKNLAMLGVKLLLIVDYDFVELSNISRMFFFEEEDLGRPKAEVLARKVVEKYPYVEATSYNMAVEDVPLEAYLKSDVIVCGLDNVSSRIHLASLATRYRIPMVDGGIHGYRTRVHTYVPPDSACPVCHLPAGRFSDLIGLRNPCDPDILDEDIKVPSLPTSISLVSAIQTQEVTKLILWFDGSRREMRPPEDMGGSLRGAFVNDLNFNKYSVIEMKRNDECIVCGRNGIGREAVEHVDVKLSGGEETVGELIDRIVSKLGKGVKSLDLFTISERRPQRLQTSRSLKSYGLDRINYLTALFTEEGKDYGEAVIKLI
jgi:molybdopterin/thiamine biosynthesis adenylyltransferase